MVRRDNFERLQNKLAVYAWSRDLTNQTPAELYPLKLAQLATDYIKALAPEHVTTRLIQGEELTRTTMDGDIQCR